MTEVAAKIIYVGNDRLFNKRCYDHMLSNGVKWIITSHHIKINSKFIKDINVRSKTLELLEEKRRVSLQLEC